MIKFSRLVIIGMLAVLATLGLTSPASADVSIRDGKIADLYLRSANPSQAEIERQYAAYWNPNVPLSAKYQVTYRGDTPKVRSNLAKVMASSRTYDFFSIKGRSTGPATVSGNRLSAPVAGVIAGLPASKLTLYWIRDNGLWKYDQKTFCLKNGCSGSKDWGY
ncbi:MAG: hypothetical protein QM673_09130 [Gordonia sp. (in: high G+C Gram-positive bacteria)]